LPKIIPKSCVDAIEHGEFNEDLKKKINQSKGLGDPKKIEIFIVQCDFTGKIEA